MPETPERIFDVCEADFEDRVLKASYQVPVMVDFWAEWCSPCLVLAPVLERIMVDIQGGVKLAKLEVDDNMRLAGHYKIRGFPTVVLFVDGQEVARFASARAKNWIENFLQEHLPARDFS